MIKITNIRRAGNKIFVDCYAEGKESGYFSMVLDAETYEIIECSSQPSMYTRQARVKIISFLKSGETLPQEAYSYWY